MVKYMSSYDKISTIFLSVTTSAVLASMAILLSSNTSADSTSANATVTVGSACTMTATVNTVHTTEIPAGSSKTNIGSTTLNTICNDVGGYAIYAVGYSGNEYGNNKMLNGTNEINTGTGTSASNWNMSLSQVTTGTYATTIDGGFGSYSAIPSTYTKVAHRDSMTDSTTGSSINLTYGAYVASTQAPGDYVGKVKFTMVHPAMEIPLAPQQATAGCINYFPNGSNVIGTMGCQSATDNASVTLLASNFSRTGYGFAGWSDAYDYATNSSANFYGPQEKITVPEGTTANGLSLYAVWIKSQGSIQDTSKVASVCSSLTTAPTDGTANLSSVTALTDQRDGETYAVAKLADGKCWMIENLRLQNTGTDNANGSLSQGYNPSFIGLAEPETPWANNSTDANSLYTTEPDVQGKNTISGSNQGYRFPRYNNVNTPTNTADRPQDPTTNSATNNTSNASMYSYGNYYTWAAAIADTTNYTTNNQSVTNTSICPSGWRLPQGGNKTRIESDDDNDFWNLTVDALNNGTTPANYNSSTAPYYTGTAEAGPVVDKLRSYPNNFVYSGGVVSGSVYDRGSFGDYWSSTAYSSSYAYFLYLGSSYVYPGTGSNYKYVGLPVRCVVSGV